MSGFFDPAPSQAGGTLTEQDLLDFMECIYSEPPQVCHPHVVHPKELERGGWAVCADCFSPVLIP